MLSYFLSPHFRIRLPLEYSLIFILCEFFFQLNFEQYGLLRMVYSYEMYFLPVRQFMDYSLSSQVRPYSFLKFIRMLFWLSRHSKWYLGDFSPFLYHCPKRFPRYGLLHLLFLYFHLERFRPELLKFLYFELLFLQCEPRLFCYGCFSPIHFELESKFGPHVRHQFPQWEVFFSPPLYQEGEFPRYLELCPRLPISKFFPKSQVYVIWNCLLWL